MNIFKVVLVSVLGIILFSCKTNNDVKFAFVTDLHIGRENSDEDLQRTVTDINSMEDIDFVVVTGDISNFGEDEELQGAKDILDKLNKNWYIFPGNHDTKWTESGCSSFKKIFGSEHFFFKFGKYNFVGCGSGPEMRMGPGMVPRADVAWLDSVITKTAGEPVIYLNHYPVNETLANWYKIIDILKKGNPQAILCGHGHKNWKMDFDGIPGAMGRANIRDKEDVGGYNVVTIESDSIFFAERTPGTVTHEIWNRFKLAPLGQDSIKYPRPSYEINLEYPQVKELWSLQDSSDIVSGVTVVGNLCFYTNTAGCIICLNIDSGEIFWKYKTNGKIFSTPAYANGKVVAASTDGTIYCLNSESGNLEWDFPTSKAIVASPLIENGVVYIGSSEGKFRAISLVDGKIIWENSEIQGFVETKPTVDSKHIYFGDWRNHFNALDKNTGEIVWQWTNEKSNFYSPAACIPVVANGKVFIVDPDRFTTAFDANSGEQIWRSKECEGRESIGVSEDKSVIYIKTMQDSVVAISTKGNEYKEEWSVNCHFGFELDPASSIEKEGVVFVPTDKGLVYAIDEENREIKWARKLSNALVNTVYPLGKKQLLTSTMDGKIFKLEFE